MVLFVAAFVFACFSASIGSTPVSKTSSWTGPDHELLCWMEVPEGAEVLFLEWTLKDPDRHVLLHRDGIVTFGRAFKNRVELRDPELRSGDMSIMLKNISTKDSGEYKCHARIETLEGQENPHSKFIHLTVKPVELIVAQSGEDQELPCASPPGGAKVQHLRWTRDGLHGYILQSKDGRVKKHPALTDRVELRDPELRSGDMTIRLKNISTEDSGVYTCEAWSHTSDRRQEVFQRVHLKVEPVKQIVVSSGEDWELPCASPPGGAKVKDLRWTREGLQGNVLRYKDGRVEKHPALTDRLELRDPELRSGDMTITMKNLSTADSGVYKCQAQFQASDREKKVYLQSVRLTVKPGKQIMVSSGEDWELPCASALEGATVLDLHWTRVGSDGHVLRYKDGKLQDEHQNPRFKTRVELRYKELRSGDITLKNLSTEDSGVYKCQAQFQASDRGKKVYLQSVHLTVKPGKQIIAQAGEKSVLPCASALEGATVLDLRWTREGSDGHVLRYKDGKLQDEHQNQTFKTRVELRDKELRSGNIRLKKLSTEDSGVYKCQAQFQTEDGGQQEVFLSVHLTVKPGGHSWKTVSGVLAVILVGIVCICIAVFMRCYIKPKNQTSHRPVSSTNEDDEGEESDEDGSSAQTPRRSITGPQPKFSSLGRKDEADDLLLSEARRNTV